MNRIRNAYLQITPEVEPYFVMSAYDDDAGLDLSMGRPPGVNLVVDIIVSTPFLVLVINSVLGGVIASLLADQLGLATPAAVVVALVAVVLVFGLQTILVTRGMAAAMGSYKPKFPAPARAEAEDPR